MGFSASMGWWIAAGVAVAIELATGTFYLLMIALGLAAGAIASGLGAAPAAQIVVAALVGVGATAAWHWHRWRQPRSARWAENRDMNLDIGERVDVPAWGADRTARVHYRGTTWSARLAPGAPATGGAHRVAAVEGNWLVLSPDDPEAPRV